MAGADEEGRTMEIVEFLKTRQISFSGKDTQGVLRGAPAKARLCLPKRWREAGVPSIPFRFRLRGNVRGRGRFRVRDLFETAKRSSPAIIFIDEIDAVGRYRGAGWGRHDEREQT